MSSPVNTIPLLEAKKDDIPKEYRAANAAWTVVEVDEKGRARCGCGFPMHDNSHAMGCPYTLPEYP